MQKLAIVLQYHILFLFLLQDELTIIGDLCKKHNVVAVMDEVYEWIVYNGSKHIRMSTYHTMIALETTFFPPNNCLIF